MEGFAYGGSNFAVWRYGWLFEELLGAADGFTCFPCLACISAIRSNISSPVISRYVKAVLSTL